MAVLAAALQTRVKRRCPARIRRQTPVSVITTYDEILHRRAGSRALSAHYLRAHVEKYRCLSILQRVIHAADCSAEHLLTSESDAVWAPRQPTWAKLEMVTSFEREEMWLVQDALDRRVFRNAPQPGRSSDVSLVVKRYRRAAVANVVPGNHVSRSCVSAHVSRLVCRARLPCVIHSMLH